MNLLTPAAFVGPSPEDLARCVHCGFCLQACPTYLITGLETESPRGRIQLSRAVSEGTIPLTPDVVRHFDLCLQCRACETACPSGVPYGRIMEDTRALVQESAARPTIWRLRTLALRLLFERPGRLRFAFSLLRFYQRLPGRKLLRRLLPRRLRDAEAMLPTLPAQTFAKTDARPSGIPRATVALLTGCIMSITSPEVHEATMRVLGRNGVRVVAPGAQGCCGALHLHNGDRTAARRLARRNIDAFMAAGAEAIIVNAAGCGSTMKEYESLFEPRDPYHDKAATVAAMTRDISEYLAALPFEQPTGRVDVRVTYQDACHLAHAQKVREAPRQVLRSIPGLEFVEMATPDRCCGSAGIYNLTQPAMSRQLLESKMKDIEGTACDAIATANPGCAIQIEAGVRISGSDREVVHVVELLDRSYRADG